MVKKKGGKKKGKGSAKKGPAIIDGVAVSDMTREQVEGHLERLREELNREREERNYFQLERDKINTFWEIARQHLDDARAEIRNNQRTIEEAEVAHRTEISVYKQKIKHLLYEHQASLTELKAEYHEDLKQAEDEHVVSESAINKDKHQLDGLMRERTLAEQQLVRDLKLKYAEQLSTQLRELEDRLHEADAKYERRQRVLREELDLRRRTELHQLTETKNAHINRLVADHEKAFADMKNYYNDITLNNLALINTLKEQVEVLKTKEERADKEMNEVMRQNRNLIGPLEKANARVSELEKRLEQHGRDKESLQRTKARLCRVSGDHASLSWQHQVLEQRFDQVESERDHIYQRFVAAISEVQQKASLRSLLLERRLAALSDSLEKKEAQLSEVLAASNLDPSALGIVNRKLEEMLDAKNNAIKDMQYELARLCKTHADTVAAYTARLEEYGVPRDVVLGPAAARQHGKLGRGPAANK